MRHDEDPRPAFKLVPEPNSVEGGKPGLPEPSRDSNQGPAENPLPGLAPATPRPSFAKAWGS